MLFTGFEPVQVQQYVKVSRLRAGLHGSFLSARDALLLSAGRRTQVTSHSHSHGHAAEGHPAAVLGASSPSGPLCGTSICSG